MKVFEVPVIRYVAGAALLSVGLLASPPKKDSAPAPKVSAPSSKSSAGSKPGASGTHSGATAGSHAITTSSGGSKGSGVSTSNTGGGHATTTTGGHAGGTPTRPGSSPVAHTAPSPTHRPVTNTGKPIANHTQTMHTRDGSTVQTHANGKPADVHVAGKNMDIHHGLNGSRSVSVTRPDGSRVVADGAGHGYVAHSYSYNGHTYESRTYVSNNVVYRSYYSSYSYRGYYMNVYAPGYYYAPGFYGWAYNPWAAPISYGWGWGGNPWYGYYGAYFAPYPVYPSAAYWLTDYMVAATLQAAYAAQAQAAAAQAAQAQADATVAMSTAVKDQIAAEVQRQIALENAEAQTAKTAAPDGASSGIQRMMTDGVQHVFVTGKEVDVTDASGNECPLSEGDAIQLTGPPPADATTASLTVLSSRGQDCHIGTTVSVAFTDLQDMQNSMRQTIDKGMGDLKAKQGSGGLPATPAAASAAPVQSQLAQNAPPPDPNAASEINQQVKAADQAEQQVVAQATPDGAAGTQEASAAPAPVPAPAAPPAAPAQISLGQSIDDVTAALGQPSKKVNLGSKQIYIYSDMKITFKDGKVSSVD